MNCPPSSKAAPDCISVVPQIGYIDGDTRLVQNAVPMYYRQFLSSAVAAILNVRDAPLFQLFFSKDNVEYLRKQIEVALIKLTGEPFRVPVNNEFGQAMATIAETNIGLSEEVSFLPWLNYTFVHNEVSVQFASYRQALMYHTWILENDRPKYLPYGDAALQTKGELTVSHSSYNLTHPWQAERNKYLLVTQGLQYCSPKNQYERIPHYLKPTVPHIPLVPPSENGAINSCCK